MIGVNNADGKRNSANNGLNIQIGYGRKFEEESGGSNYLLLGVKKYMF
jgi:hypothetical protein